MKIPTGELNHDEICLVTEQVFPDVERIPGGYELRVVPKKKLYPLGIRKAKSYVERIHIVFTSDGLDVHADRNFEIKEKHHVDPHNELASEVGLALAEVIAAASLHGLG
jgi:hypothetical protein